eukprot:jgi/Psemu1/47747/gm1.47747_g
MPDPVAPSAPVAPEQDNSSDDRIWELQWNNSHLPPAVTFSVPTALARNNIEATTPAPLPQEFTLASILTALEGNKLSLGPNTEKIKGLTFNTTAHEKKKKRFLAEFFRSLAAHPQAAPLAELIPDPITPSLMKHRFFIQCRAPSSPNKLALINYCMLIYSMNLYKVIYRNIDLSKDAKLYADARYHPNSVNQRMKCLFAIFGKEHINYSLATDSDHPGGFQAYWKKNFAITGEHRKSYGKLPNKAQFDPKWFTKRWKAVQDPKNPLDPFNNIEHYEPASLVKEDFETGLIQEGEFAGIPFVRLKETYSSQKNCALSLKHNIIDEENTRKRTLPCPYSSDALSTYQTTIKLLSMVPDDCQNSNRIFRKPTSKKQIKASIWEKEGCSWRLNRSPSKVIGVHKVNELLVQIAIWSGCDNPERCTAHGKRHEALSKVANASVCPSLIKGMGGHASIDNTTRYIKPNQQAIDAAVRAKHGSPSKIAPRAPSPAPAPAPRAPSSAPAPAPASPAGESQAPAPFLDESPCSPSNTPLQFEVPNKSPPAFPSNISLGTGKEPSPWREHNLHHDYRNEPHYKDRRQFAEDRPCEPRYGYEDRSRLRYKYYNRYEPLYKGEPPPPPRTKSYEPRYKERHKPRPQDSRRVSFGENRSYCYEPRYKEERKPRPQDSRRVSFGENQSYYYEPRYKEERKPPPRRLYEPRYEEERKPPPRQSYEPRYEEQRPSLAEKGSHARRPPPQERPLPQDPRCVSFGENHYHRYDEQNGAWDPSPVEVFSGYPPSIGRPSFASTDPEAQVTSVVRQIGTFDVPGRQDPCEGPA